MHQVWDNGKDHGLASSIFIWVSALHHEAVRVPSIVTLDCETGVLLDFGPKWQGNKALMQPYVATSCL